MRVVVVVPAAAATKPLSLEIERLQKQAFFYSPDLVIGARKIQTGLATHQLPRA